MKPNKKFLFWALVMGLLVAMMAMPAFGEEEDCDNEDPPECDPCEEECDDSDGANRFEVYSGNVKRSVSDLKMAVQVGEHPLVFSRMHSSRSVWAVQVRSDFVFGRAGNWRHSHQWTILDDGEFNGCQGLQVIAPNGRVNYYHKKATNDLFMTYLPGTHSRIWPDGSTNFYLYHLDGTKYHITQGGGVSNKTFRMEGFWDAYSNWYGYTYGEDGYLARVTGPNTNQYLELEYRDLEGAVAPGWVRFSYTNDQAAEVLIPGTWNDWTGTQTPMQTNSSGIWEADLELGEGFYEYKFAVRNQGGGAWQLVADPDNPLLVGPDSNSLAVVSAERIIERVTAGDGRSVEYVYDWDWNNGQKVLAMRLREAQYGTGESALYDYYPAAHDQYRGMLLKSADDPHVAGMARAISYTYHTNRLYSGQIHEERLLSSSQLVARLEYDPTNHLRRTVVKADGSTNEYLFVSGGANTEQKTDAAGQTIRRIHFGGNGMLQARVDPMGRTSVYTRTWHFGAVLSVSNACGCRGDRVNTYTDNTYPFYLASTADAAGNTTMYQRDSAHRPIAVYHPDGTSEYFEYNAHGQATVEKRRDGATWTNAYDLRGRRTSTTGPGGACTGYGYDEHDRVSSETNALGLVTTTEYNWAGKPTRKVYPDSTEELWQYDRYGSVTQAVSRSGGITVYEYDERGNQIRVTDPVGAVTETTYDLDGRKVLETSPSGLVVSNTYDVLGRRIRRTYSSDNTFETWTYVYDGVSAHTNRLGYGTTNAYNADGQLASVTDARGNTTHYTYDPLGRRVAIQNALGQTTTQTLDPSGRVTSTTDDDGLAVTNTYNANGQLIQSVQRGGITNDYAYDAAGRRTNVVLNGATVSSTAYDAIGRTAWTRNADGVVVSNAYDAAGRLHRVYMPDGTYAENVYSNGWLWKTIDRAGRTNITERDAVGRLVQTIDPSGGTVQYRHDPSGNLTNLVDQAGNNTFWTFDAEGRQTRKTYADATHWDYTYDAAGRLTSRTDAKNQTTHYQYDAVGNLTNINYPNDSDVSFTYDALNRKIQMTDGIGATTYAYSSCCGLRESEDGPFANDKLYFDYTDAKQLASITSAFQRVAYTYDNLQRLKTVVGPEGTNTYSYEGAGTVWRNLQLGNGTAVTRQFDDLLRLTNMVNDSASGILSSFAITVDNADQRTRVIREDGTRYDYSYDAIGQLVGAHATLPDQTPWEAYQFGYQYDATGNPVEQDKNGLVSSNSFNHLNQNVATVPGGTLAVLGRVNYAGGTVAVNSVQAQLSPNLIFAATGIPFTLGTNTLNTVFSDPFGRSTNQQTSVVVSQKAYGYDANGNLTNDGRMAYFWNDENRLVAVRDAKTGTLLQENRYDGHGRRRERIQISVAGGDDPGSTNRYLYQDWLVLGVTDGAGYMLETYNHGADLSGQVGGAAGGIGGILASTQEGGSAYYHYDFNGNVVNVSGSNQIQRAKYTYSPFGEVLLKEGPCDSRYQFSTKELDGSTGMNYYGYRFYSPGLGRWINRDPIEEDGGLNMYCILINDTINWYDVLGLSKWPQPPIFDPPGGPGPGLPGWKVIIVGLMSPVMDNIVNTLTDYMDKCDPCDGYSKCSFCCNSATVGALAAATAAAAAGHTACVGIGKGRPWITAACWAFVYNLHDKTSDRILNAQTACLTKCVQ